MTVSSDLPLHLIGTRAFLPALLAYIQNLASSTSLPLDHVIFQSTLLCLIAGDKHLILRAPEEDVGLTVKLAVWTLSCVFNLPTHKLKIRDRSSSRSRNNVSSASDPSAFLRSLFLPSGSSSSNSNQTSQDEGSGENVKHFGHHRQRSGKHKPKQQLEYSRSRSFPNNLAAAAQTHGTTSGAPDVILMQGVTLSPESGITTTAPYPPASPSILKPQPIYPYLIPHSYTDPLPLPPIRTKSISRSKPLPQLPQALVISGLEYASDSTQRSLSRVLAEKRVVLESQGTTSGLDADKGTFTRDDEDGVWNLPEGFITVYVCPWSARERPALHKSLLDKFAMSANVFVPQNIRRDFHLLPFSPAPRPFHPNFVAHSNPGSPSPSYPLSLPPTNTPPIFTKSLPLHQRPSTHFNPPILPDGVLPRSFIKALQDARHRAHISYTLSLYLSDIFSATRHNSRLDAMLLTAKAMRDAEDLVCASRVIGNDPTGMELVQRSGMPQVDGDDIDDQDGTSYNESTDPISKDYVRLSGGHSMLSGDAGEQSVTAAAAAAAAAAASVLDVSEVDVARIVPRVISHRVRLRDGPEDEVLSSALFGATFKSPVLKPPVGKEDGQTQTVETMQSVKAVLVSILSEV